MKLEQKDENVINYLDIKIVVEEGNILTSVYRKPSYKPVLIPNWSDDPISYKKAMFRSFFRRAILYDKREEDLKDEIDYIVIKIEEEHGYKKSFIISIFNSVKRSMAIKNKDGNIINTQRPTDNSEGYLPVPHSLKKYNFVRRLVKKQ